MTCTALYRIMEVTHLRNELVMAVPPSLGERWSRNRKDPDLLGNLATCFQSGTEDTAKTVYVLPPLSECVEALAICSLTSTCCSTLVIGTEEATKDMKTFLQVLFKSISCWPSGFSWERFHQVLIKVCMKANQERWVTNNHEDVGIVLAGTVLESLWAGCRGLGELLGCEKISEKVLNIVSIRRYGLRSLLTSDLTTKNSGLSNQHSDPISPDDSDVLHASENSTESDSSDDADNIDEFGSDESDEPVELNTVLRHLNVDSGDQVQDGMIKDEVVLDVDKVTKEMTEIDMDDAVEVEERIVAALEPTEREWYTITAEDETQVLS